MKKYLVIMISLLIQSVFLASCGKDDPSPDSGGNGSDCSGTSVIKEENITFSGSTTTEKRKYYYYSNKKVAKVEYTLNSDAVFTKYDSVYYSPITGLLDSVMTYNVSNMNTPIATKKYSYDGSGKITSILETGSNNNGAYKRTRTYTYNGSGKLMEQEVVYTSGSSDTETGAIENITDIKFSGNNISEGTIGISGTVLNSTTAANPFYGMNLRTEDIFAIFNANNMTEVSAPFVGSLFTRTYTYENGRVKTISESHQAVPYSFTTLIYDCLP